MWGVWGLLGRLTEIVKLQFSNKHVLRKFCFADRASQYMCVTKTNLMQYLYSLYFVSQPLHVLGIFVAHHQEVYYIYKHNSWCVLCFAVDCWPTDSQLKSTTRTNCCIYSIYLMMMDHEYSRNT